jgi:phospholipid/cholesterol/gamma-HCH transport system permease protein
LPSDPTAPGRLGPGRRPRTFEPPDAAAGSPLGAIPPAKAGRNAKPGSWPAAWTSAALGWTGRRFLRWLARRADQAAFAGRLLLMGLWGFSGGRPARRRLMRRLILVQAWELLSSACALSLIFGFMTGFLWTIIWFGALSNVGGVSTLAGLLVSVQVQEISPILTIMAVVMTYGGPMALEVALLKASGDFRTLALMGVPPAHAVAWPRLIGTVLTFPSLMTLMNVAALSGAYWGIVRAIDLPLVEFAADLATNAEPLKIVMLGVKSLLCSLALSFFCLHKAFAIPEGGFLAAPRIARGAMAEAFVFSVLASVLVTVLYDSAP